MAAAERCFGPDHPAVQGHFPGNPVVPGAVMLVEVLRAIEQDTGAHQSPFRIRFAKFFAPVRPGDRVSIELAPTGSGGTAFSCTVGDKLVLRGEVACGAARATS